METPDDFAGRTTERIMLKVRDDWQKRHNSSLPAADYNKIYEAILAEMYRVQP